MQKYYKMRNMRQSHICVKLASTRQPGLRKLKNSAEAKEQSEEVSKDPW